MIDYGYGARLKALDRSIAQYCRHWRNDPAIRQWCRQRFLISDAEQERWYDGIGESTRMYLVTSVEDEPAGVCGLTSLDPWNRRAEFSLYIRPDRQCRGAGKAALKTLLSHGFHELGLNVIWGETFDGNPAEKMFAELGMVKEGTRRQFYFKDGRFLDAHIYSMLESEWRRRSWPFPSQSD